MFGEEVDFEGQYEDSFEFKFPGDIEQAADNRVPNPRALEPGVHRDGAYLTEIGPQHMQGATAHDVPVELGHPELLNCLVQRHKVLFQQDAPGIDVDERLDSGHIGGTGTTNGHRGSRVSRDAGCTFSAHA